MAQQNLLAVQETDFQLGQDAARTPCKTPPNAYYSGINVTTKYGSLRPRWGLDTREVQFSEESYTDALNRSTSFAHIFSSGKFQAFIPYKVGVDPFVLIVVSGFIFYFNVRTNKVECLDPAIRLSPRAARLNWSFAADHVVIYDHPNYPVIITGLAARRADPAKNEIPVSTIGAYNSNRLFIANNGAEFTAGDPTGSPATPDAPLTFNEVLLPSASYIDQIFKLSTNFGYEPITAMGFLQAVDTSTGIGPLIIGTTNSIFSYNAHLPRQGWEAGQFGANIVFNAGIASNRAMANVNSDMFFISPDGYVRSLAMSRDEQKKWSKVPISREVENWFKFWDKDLVKYSFVGYFKNKIFFSVNPYRMYVEDVDTKYPIFDYAFGGLCVLELDNVTSFGEANRPAWAGLWTYDIRPMDMCTVGEQCFIIGKRGNQNVICEVNPEASYDTRGCDISYVHSRVYTREYNYEDDFMNKELHSADLNITGIQGDFKTKLFYKPAHSEKFAYWGAYEFTVPWRSCVPPCTGYYSGYLAQSVRDVTIGSPQDEACDPTTKDYLKFFKKIQFAIDLTGIDWTLEEIKFKALARPKLENVTTCTEYAPVAQAAPCINDWCLGESGCQLTKTT